MADRVVLVTTATVPGLRRLEGVLHELDPRPDGVAVAVQGPRRRRWPREVASCIGPRTRFLLDQDLVEVPRDPGLAWLDPIELLGLDEDAFRARFKKTSLWRNRRAGLLRNAAIVLGNVGDARALPALEKALADGEDVIRDAAAWAIARIRQRTSNW